MFGTKPFLMRQRVGESCSRKDCSSAYVRTGRSAISPKWDIETREMEAVDDVELGEQQVESAATKKK